MAWYTTERSGASPRPPATTTRSFPIACSIGQWLPNGPRTPITSPGLSTQNAFDTSPTSRVVWMRDRRFVGSPLIEIGISPTFRHELYRHRIGGLTFCLPHPVRVRHHGIG